MTIDNKTPETKSAVTHPKADMPEKRPETVRYKSTEARFANRMAALRYFRPYVTAMAGTEDISKTKV